MSGVGTELTKLYKRIGIRGCDACGGKAAEWNARGIPWCEENMQELVDWLTQQAAKSKVSIVAAATRLAIEEPLLAAKIAGLQIMHPLTDISELAAVAIVDFALERATETPKPIANPRTPIVREQSVYAEKQSATLINYLKSDSPVASVRLDDGRTIEAANERARIGHKQKRCVVGKDGEKWVLLQ